MAKRETLHSAVVLSMNNERDALILKGDVKKKPFIDSEEKAMKYVTQIEKKKRVDLQKKFY